MSELAPLWLSRHGETVWHAENRYAGADSDIDLTDLGRQQARRLGAWARAQQIEVVLSSPVRRARETAGPAAEATGRPLQAWDGLREIDFGSAEGRTAAEIELAAPHVMADFRRDPVAHPFPGSESPGDAAERGASALCEIAARYRGDRVLVVAHNTLLRLALCRLLGIPVQHYRRVFPRLDNAALTQIEVPLDGSGLASLRRFNLPPPEVPI